MEPNIPNNLNTAPTQLAPNQLVGGEPVNQAQEKPVGKKRSFKKLFTIILIFSTAILTPLVGFIGILFMLRLNFGKLAKSILVALFIILSFLNIGIIANYFNYNPVDRGSYRVIAINGDTMNPTFKKGAKLLTTDYKQGSNLNRDDIVAYQLGAVQLTEGALLFIGRIIAIPSDELELKDGFMYLNGQKTDISYIKGSGEFTLLNEGNILKVPESSYYIVFDNRSKPDSMIYDSRNIGPIPSKFIQLKVIKCYEDCQ